MVLELHVWGPAFSLPSVEAQCLATIAFCSLALPKDTWVLVASSDPTVSPTCELPALRNGSKWVSRFRNIVDYLRQYSNGEWDLDGELSGLEKADNIAFSSFIESRAQALTDLSLYVTSQNYYARTSPAYGSLLHWPNQWILPPKLHAAAKARTDHLGLSSLDLAAIEDQRKRDHSAAVAAGQVPKNMIPPRQESVSGMLGRTAQQNQFRLEALTAELFEPLEEKLGGKGWLLGEMPSTIDCLALGYLSLAAVGDMPHPWLLDAMRAKAPGVLGYTERLRGGYFGVVEEGDAYTETPRAGSKLPWQAPRRARLATVGSTLYNTLADATPIWRDVRAHNRLRETVEAPSSGLSEEESKMLSSFARGQRKDVLLSVGAVVGGIAALVGYMAHVGLLSIPVGGDGEEEEEEEYEVGDDLFQAPDILSTLG